MARIAFWVLFAATLGVYATMLVWTLPAISAAAGGLPAFDMRPAGYDLAAAQAFLSALTPEGRSLYQSVQLRLDIVYPALLSATLLFALLALLPRRWGPWRIVLAILALPPMIFDYLENTGIAAMLAADPKALDAALVSATSGWSVLKSTTSTVAMTLLLVALVWWGVRTVRRRRAAARMEPKGPAS